MVSLVDSSDLKELMAQIGTKKLWDGKLELSSSRYFNSDFWVRRSYWFDLACHDRWIEFISILTLLKPCEFLSHSWVPSSQFLDCHILSLVVRQLKISIIPNQRILCFLQVINWFINFLNGCLELSWDKIVILHKSRFERIELILKIGNINISNFD